MGIYHLVSNYSSISVLLDTIFSQSNSGLCLIYDAIGQYRLCVLVMWAGIQ